MTKGKQKLTLSVDAETVDRAKSLGINISELTEQVLDSFTFRPEDAEREAIMRQRKELFDSMNPLISRYKLRVPVGVYIQDGHEAWEVVMVGQNKFEYLLETDPEEVWAGGTIQQILLSSEDYVSFYSVDTILKNFMKAVEEEKTKRKQQVASLVAARKIVEAITRIDDTEMRAKHAPQVGPKK